MAGGPPLNTYTLKKLEQVARKAALPGELLAELFTHVFSEVVLQVVQTPSTDVTELDEILELAEKLQLTDFEIKDGLTLAAVKLGKTLKKRNDGFFQTNLPEHFLLHAAKLFFISNKMIGSNDGYYGRRLTVALCYMPDEMMKEVITDACTQLFIRCVDSVINNPSDFSEEEISSFREFLTVSADVSGLRPATMQDLIMTALTTSIDSTMGENARENAMSTQLGNYRNLQAARNVFGWEDMEFEKTVETKTMPVFEIAARKIIEECVESPDRASELKAKLHERMDALNIDPRKARILLTTIVSDQNIHYMAEIDKVYNTSGGALEPTFKMMATYSATFDALKSIVSDIMNGSDLPIPGLPFADMVKVSMFEMQLARKDERLTDDKFALNEKQRAIVVKNMALPKIASWIKQCIIEDNLSPDAKAAYEKLLREKEIGEEEWGATAIDFYYQELEKVAKIRAIPSSVDMDRIARLKEFLGCSESLVAKVNMELLGEKYIKAVKESMMPSGVIAEEYVEGLERLRNRLGISKADTEKLLGLSTRTRVGEVVKDLVNQWKSDTGAIERKDTQEKKDKSGDPISSVDNVLGYMETGANVMETGGPNVFMREALNLVDHVIENYQISQDIDLTKQDTEFPVTAVGYASEEELFEVYKHYIVTRLMEKDTELKTRYARDEAIFARILGIPPDSQSKIKETFLYSAYKRMLKKTLLYKESIDASDLQQFAFLKEALSMEKEICDRILYEASKGAVIEHTASIMRPKDVLITADMARRLRGQIGSLDLDMREDIGLNPSVVSYLYSLEVQAAIEEGEEIELLELQEAYSIPEETAAYIVDVTSRRYISQLLSIGLSHAKKYEEALANSITEKIVNFMDLIEGSVDADGNLFNEDDKERLVVFFRDREHGDLSEKEKRRVSARLRSLINLTENFVAPLEGIAGLKGEAKTDRTATGMMM